MHVDHLSYAAGPDGLLATADRLSQKLGVESIDGGFHPRFGTRNRTIALDGGRYVEVVEVLDHPASEKAPFGQAVRARSEAGGGWLGWVLAMGGDDLPFYERLLERPAVVGQRYLPDGSTLEWKQLGVKGMMADPQLPFFVQWLSPDELRPGADGSAARLTGIELRGDRTRLDQWLGKPHTEALDHVPLQWVTGEPAGVVAATFSTPAGEVRI